MSSEAYAAAIAGYARLQLLASEKYIDPETRFVMGAEYEFFVLRSLGSSERLVREAATRIVAETSTTVYRKKGGSIRRIIPLIYRERDVDDIRIVGTSRFIEETAAALAVLATSSMYDVIRHHICVIRQSRCATYIQIDVRRPTVHVDETVWKYDAPIVYAGKLAHEAYHSIIHRVGGNPVGLQAERDCTAFQVRALLDMGIDSECVHLKDLLAFIEYSKGIE